MVNQRSFLQRFKLLFLEWKVYLRTLLDTAYKCLKCLDNMKKFVKSSIARNSLIQSMQNSSKSTIANVNGHHITSMDRYLLISYWHCHSIQMLISRLLGLRIHLRCSFTFLKNQIAQQNSVKWYFYCSVMSLRQQIARCSSHRRNIVQLRLWWQF